MVARGSERIVDAIEELILELPARVRGSRTKLSEQALAAEPTPSLADAVTSPEPATASARREKRQQRRRSRPHGRAR